MYGGGERRIRSIKLEKCYALWLADLHVHVATPRYRVLDPDLMQAENADSAGLTQLLIQPATFACNAVPPGGQKSWTYNINIYIYYIDNVLQLSD